MPEAELSLMFLRPLNQLGIRYIVGGGVAAILYGEPRFTNDLDLVVFLRHSDIPRLIEVFPAPEFYVPPADAIAAEIARPEKGQFNLIHADTGFKADLYTTGRDEFNAWAFRNSCKTEFSGEPSPSLHRSMSSFVSWNSIVKAALTNIFAIFEPCSTSHRLESIGRIWMIGFVGAGWKRNGNA